MKDIRLKFIYCLHVITILGSIYYLCNKSRSQMVKNKPWFSSLNSIDIKDRTENFLSEQKQDVRVLVMPVNDITQVKATIAYSGIPPNLTHALDKIELVYNSGNKSEKTFSILDSHTAIIDSRNMEITMRLETEKTGHGKIINKQTGETVWSCKIIEDPLTSGRSTN